MATGTEVRRGIWHILWDLATSGRSLGVALLFLAVCLLLFLVIPQAPADSQEDSLWLLRIQARFGSATAPMDALGLFSMERSPLLRLALAALAFILLVRTVDRLEVALGRRGSSEEPRDGVPVSADGLEELAGTLRRRGYRTRMSGDAGTLHVDRWPWADLAVFALHLGCMILLLGLLVGELWGWQEEGILGRPGEMVALPDGREVLVTDEQAGVGIAPPGVRLYSEGTGPELVVESSTAEGSPLGLQLTPDGATFTSLQLRLTEAVADTYLAIPAVGLVIRIVPEQETLLEADSPLRVQLYRTPSGELAQEVVVTGDTTLQEGDTHVTFTRGYYLVFAAASDPGYWLKVSGLVLAALALLVQVAWPPRRFWIRQEETQLVGGGELPAGYAEDPGPGRARHLSKRVVFVLLGVLGAVVAGMALTSLSQSGGILEGAAVRIGMAILLLVWAAVCLVY